MVAEPAIHTGTVVSKPTAAEVITATAEATKVVTAATEAAEVFAAAAETAEVFATAAETAEVPTATAEATEVPATTEAAAKAACIHRVSDGDRDGNRQNRLCKIFHVAPYLLSNVSED